MPNLLDGVLGDDANFAFCNADEWGESVTYTPLGGVARTITAVIDRDPPADPSGKVPRPRMTALIQRHATRGTTSINSGGDTLTLAYRIGGTAEAFLIGAPIKEDQGAFLVPLT